MTGEMNLARAILDLECAVAPDTTGRRRSERRSRIEGALAGLRHAALVQVLDLKPGATALDVLELAIARCRDSGVPYDQVVSKVNGCHYTPAKDDAA